MLSVTIAQEPLVLKDVGLLDSSGAPTDVYKRDLRGGHPGRAVVGAAIQQADKPMFTVYPDAAAQADGDLVTFVKSNSSLDDDNARLVVRTFKVLSKFADFSGAAAGDHDTNDDDDDNNDAGNKGKTPHRRRAKSSSEVVINVNIALSVDATSDPAVYDAFFAAMAKHLGGLTDGA
jgi:hypothetical protein